MLEEQRKRRPVSEGSGGVEGQQWLLVRPRLRCEQLVADAPHGGGVWC